MKNIVIYEGDSYEKFYPFTINHASFELREGSMTMLELLVDDNDKKNVILIVRDIIKDVVADRYPDAIVNPDKIPDDCIKFYIDENYEEFPDINLFDYYEKDFKINTKLW